MPAALICNPLRASDGKPPHGPPPSLSTLRFHLLGPQLLPNSLEGCSRTAPAIPREAGVPWDVPSPGTAPIPGEQHPAPAPPPRVQKAGPHPQTPPKPSSFQTAFFNNLKKKNKIKKKIAKHHLAASLPIPVLCWSKRQAGALSKGSVSLCGDQKPALTGRAQAVGQVRMCLGRGLKAAESRAARSHDTTRHPSEKPVSQLCILPASHPQNQRISLPLLGEKNSMVFGQN